MAADDVAKALSTVASGAPLNSMVEVGGPEIFRLNEFVEQGLKAIGDPRTVVIDSQSRYAGALLSERILIPADDATRAAVLFEDWLKTNKPRPHGTIAAAPAGQRS
ncbi:MAG TPA: NmrA family transcriptional regulator, partial [Dehalococcoidia bacterium]|nr:NmrA family transcriptional regulator [Dehalococcoidia bacterium]